MRYALLYFAHFLAYGAYGPYLPLYLQRSVGLSRADIGWVQAIFGLVGLAGPFVWGPLVDHTSRRRLVMGIGFLLTAILYPLYLLTGTLPAVLLLTTLFGAVLAPLIPLMDDLALNRIRTEGGDYGHMRLWGSISFIVGSTVVGWLLDLGWGRAQFYLFVVAELASLAVILSFPDRTVNYRAASRRDLHFWRSLDAPFIIFLLCVFLGRAGTVGHYNFFSLYLDSIGVSDSLKGIAWSVGVLAEIVMMAVAGRIVRRFGAGRLFLLGLFGSAVRFVVYAVWPTVLGALAGQLFHAFSFAALHIGAVTLVGELSPPGRTGTGQLALAAFGVGLGSSVGSLVSGQIAEAWAYRGMYLASSALALGAALIATGFMRGRLRPVVAQG